MKDFPFEGHQFPAITIWVRCEVLFQALHLSIGIAKRAFYEQVTDISAFPESGSLLLLLPITTHVLSTVFL